MLLFCPSLTPFLSATCPQFVPLPPPFCPLNKRKIPETARFFAALINKQIIVVINRNKTTKSPGCYA